MKKQLLFLLITVCCSSLSTLAQTCINTALGGQSGCARSNFYYGEIAPFSGTTNVTVFPYSPGEYFRIPVLAGGCYTISTCGAPFDTQINCFEGNNTSGPFAYDDDSGPDCGGLAASCVMVPAFTDYARIDVRQYACLAGGSSSITVYVRQNNNLSITSSASAMCEGEVRSLTAVPATVVTVPQPNSGNVGTFTGTGVSGTTFTAPTPAGNSQVFAITYTFGYVSTTQNITVWHTPSTADAGTNFTTACDATTANLSALTPTFGTGSWTITSGSGTITTPSNPTSTITGLVPGTSTTCRWTVSNGPCASNFEEIVITVPVSPTPTASNTGPYCAGATIQLNSPGGSATDDWMGPNSFGVNDVQNPTIASATLLMAGDYTVTVTDVNGCTGTSTTTVVINPVPVASASNTGPYCEGATIQLNSIGGSATDDWSGPNSYAQNDMQDPTIPSSAPIMSGDYMVTVTDGNGCTSTSTTTVTVNATPTPTASNTGPYCEGTTIQLNSDASSSMNDWTGPNSYNQPNTQNPTIVSSTPLMAGVYTVTVTNGAGCTGTSTTTVIVDPAPAASATNTGPYCEGVTIQLNSIGGSATDDWEGPNLYVENNNQNPTIPTSLAVMSGVYTVTVTDGIGCSNTATTTVVVNANPTPTATNTGPYCEGDTIQLGSPMGSATDDWTGPSYTQNDVQNPTITSAITTMSGTYIVTVTDGNGCSGTASTNVTVNTNPNPTASNTGPYCEGETIQLSSNGLPTDDWTGPNSFAQTNNQNPTISSATTLMAGVYEVTVTNGSGCSTTATTTVVVNVNPVPTASNTGPYCQGVTIQLNSVGGSATDDWTGPLSYNQPNTQNPTITSSTMAMSGVYTVTVTDGNGCTGTGTTSVSVIDCSGIEEETAGNINLYPNPTNGKFAVSITNEFYGDVTMYLYDINGKMVYQSVIGKSGENIIQEIDITEQRHGMYILHVVFDGEQRTIKRVIKH